MNFKCPCGQKVDYESESRNSYNVGDAVKLTGWMFLPTRVGGAIWLCPDCAVKAKDIAQQLMAVVQTVDIHFPSLIEGESK